jgi:hypothetical protein
MRRQQFLATALFVVAGMGAGAARGQDGPMLPGYQVSPQSDAGRERYLAPRQLFKKRTGAEANSPTVQAPQVVDDRGNVAPQPSTGKSRSKLLRRSPATVGNADGSRRGLSAVAPFGGALSKATAARIDRNRQIRASVQQNGSARNVQPNGQAMLGQNSFSTPDTPGGDTGRRLLQQPTGAASSMRRMARGTQAEMQGQASDQARREGDSAPRWTGALSAPPTDSGR